MRQIDPHFADEPEIVSAAIEPEDLAARTGARIVRLREGRRWGRRELARRLGVRPDRLGKWELGKCLPPVELLVRLARTLGVSVDELITGEPMVPRALTSKQREDLEILLEAVRKVLHEPGSVSLPR